MVGPSNNQVKKAGSAVRKYRRGEVDDLAVLRAAVSVIEEHRAAHQRPLVTANNGLRSMVKTSGCSGQVTQRLKRMSTIMEKLEREPTLSLDRMQDIGGCRVIVPSLNQLRTLRDHIVKVHPEARESDYIDSPRSSGYRALHLILEYGKPIEIQLRTEVMHAWAMVVEEYSSALGTNYKQDGSSEFQKMALALSRILASDETGVELAPEILAEYSARYRNLFPDQGAPS